ncbi:MAG: hypothetical protein IPI00_16620 [Flavobacteriales bacterium]|nr:hypothetical protein [Flavobacteriales bacterium]MBK6945639.1 hypothetical protein [Flavobacteriales bacterium]MBK7241745.1 hypothetical protein [Flavobacteriales bacterium]MBK7296253.1 hypothetical protein [Flavobacteriales bacterium]MBK9534809.1 hypothetical protein [Flavobacteriales bacterium]
MNKLSRIAELILLVAAISLMVLFLSSCQYDLASMFQHSTSNGSNFS